MLAVALSATVTALEARATVAVPQGNWYVASRDLTVALKPCDPSAQDVCGSIVELGPQSERLSAEFRRRALGMKVVHELKPVGPGRWQGRLYDPFKEAFCDFSITVLATGDLSTRACIFMDQICTVEKWRLVAGLREKAGAWQTSVMREPR